MQADLTLHWGHKSEGTFSDITAFIILLFLDEGKPGVPEKATLAVERNFGLFGDIQVTWTVSPGDEVDLRPATGFVTFSPGQDVSFITLESVPDEVRNCFLWQIYIGGGKFVLNVL